jgi:hypothetical protein
MKIRKLDGQRINDNVIKYVRNDMDKTNAVVIIILPETRAKPNSANRINLSPQNQCQINCLFHSNFQINNRVNGEWRKPADC